MITIPIDTVLTLGPHHYVVSEYLGEGHVGAVWKVETPSSHSAKALKVIYKFSAASDNLTYKQDLLNRIKLLQQIKHPHLIAIEHYGLLPFIDQQPQVEHGHWRPLAAPREQCFPFLLMPYSGSTLQDYLQQPQREQLQDITLALQLCLALRKIHGYYIPDLEAQLSHFFHGNLKPANVLIFTKGKRPQVKVGDLGLVIGQEQSAHPYQAPEQRQLEAPVDFRSDLFSLAKILQQLLPQAQPKIVELIAAMSHPDPDQRKNFLAEMNKALWQAFKDLRKKNLAESLFVLGMHLYENGHYQYALQDFAKVLELVPDFLEARVCQGDALKNLGRFQEALASYAQALEIDSQAAIVYENRGELYGEQQLYDQAIADFYKALEYDPESASAYGNLGMAYSAKGEFENALQQFNQVIALADDFAPAYVDRGDVLVQLQQCEKAIADYEKALALEIEAPQEVRDKIAHARKQIV